MAEQTKRLNISLDEGTMFLIREILRIERNDDTVSFDDVTRATISAVKRLSGAPQ